MDTTNLKTFITAAELASFSLAAEHLYLTQSAVSKRISTLETELGTRLFDRIGRRISLTEAGRMLLPRARDILTEIDDSLRLIANLSGEVNGRLSIGTSHHIGLHRLPPVLRAYTKAWPAVELDLRFMDSEAACRAVQTGQLELGIVTLPLVPLADLDSERIWIDPLRIVAGREHPLARQRHIQPSQLSAHAAILPAHGTYTRALLEQAIGAEVGGLRVSMTTNYLETIKMLVSVGLGWSVLPQAMLSNDLQALDVPGILLTRQLGVVHHHQRTLSNAARAMLRQLQASRDKDGAQT
ncbi:MAG: LysR family transcriptional regulator [Gammaproteobacteria bacterium]|nr:LysR family transcriptional regulator [Gammaproteobacteria bacterium]MCF6362054.1 LysR family transcriptional regulator [Gammaproteobacteria bacterium]